MKNPIEAPEYGIVWVTAPTRTEAEAIAEALVESRLAACVSLTPIHSIYTWKGKINKEEEWQLTIKTDLRQFTRLESTIKSLHSYEVPEIIAIPIIAGSTPYLNWISESVVRE
ncbi:divalent-cation tolerance protein CutA [Laspinema olomoucense]|uniref:divalent-cation tolerance protein CutA n=1 Tax=Laspinema olomoucense TaxID=3231600 RepID=UPI0021BAF6DA|nr:divalent-cation tolerance protein CutA [Laspinema sp. D3a]MCT7989446.1 divalent-cation tolerance protein CutA [Laspinema sp. D3a]